MRVLRALAAVVVSSSVLIAIAPAAGAAPKPPFSGRVQCNVAGQLAVKPSLVPAPVKPKAAHYKLTGTMSSCSGASSGGKGPITGGTFAWKAVVANNDCNPIATWPAVTVATGVVKVKFTGATGKAVGKSVFTMPLTLGTDGSFPITGVGSATATGPSFAGSHAAIGFVSNQGLGWTGSCTGSTAAFTFPNTTLGPSSASISFDNRIDTSLQLETGANGHSWIVVLPQAPGPAPTGTIHWGTIFFPFTCTSFVTAPLADDGFGSYGVDTGSVSPAIPPCGVNATYSGDNNYHGTSALL